jgi:hypothetical protein
MSNPEPSAPSNPEPIVTSNPEPLLVTDDLLAKAEQVCRRRLANDPDNRTVLASLAQTCRKQGKLSEATTLYQRLSHLDPEDRVAAYMHAVLAGGDVPEMPAGLRPAPFVLLKDFLPRSFHETLLPFVQSIREKLVPARVATGEYKPDTRESLDLPGKWDVKSSFHQCVRTVVPQVFSCLHVAPFEIGELEVKVRAYLDGHFFRIHMDCPKDQNDISYRKVSYVYFFHKLPRAYRGGDLLLFDSDPDVENSRFTTAGFTRIVPDDNTLVFFPSAFWHSVIPVSCPSKEYIDSRFVINGHISSIVPTPAVAPAADNTEKPAALVALGDRGEGVTTASAVASPS